MNFDYSSEDPVAPGRARRQHRWRTVGVIAWCGFLGAAVATVVLGSYMATRPMTFMSWGQWSFFFLASWLIGLVPAACAYVLGLATDDDARP